MCDFDEAKQVTHDFVDIFHRNQELHNRDAWQKKNVKRLFKPYTASLFDCCKCRLAIKL